MPHIAVADLEYAPPGSDSLFFDLSFTIAPGEHTALVGHDALDWAPLGLNDAGSYVNLMTARPEELADELCALASFHIGRGTWPWSFFCYLEDAPRPVTP